MSHNSSYQRSISDVIRHVRHASSIIFGFLGRCSNVASLFLLFAARLACASGVEQCSWRTHIHNNAKHNVILGIEGGGTAAYLFLLGTLTW